MTRMRFPLYPSETATLTLSLSCIALSLGAPPSPTRASFGGLSLYQTADNAVATLRRRGLRVEVTRATCTSDILYAEASHLTRNGKPCVYSVSAIRLTNGSSDLFENYEIDFIEDYPDRPHTMVSYSIYVRKTTLSKARCGSCVASERDSLVHQLGNPQVYDDDSTTHGLPIHIAQMAWCSPFTRTTKCFDRYPILRPSMCKPNCNGQFAIEGPPISGVGPNDDHKICHDSQDTSPLLKIEITNWNGRNFVVSLRLGDRAFGAQKQAAMITASLRTEQQAPRSAADPEHYAC